LSLLSAVMVPGATAASPGPRAGDRLVRELGQPQRREAGVDERAPDAAVVVGGARDESGTPTGEGVEVVERAEVRIGRPAVDLDTALLGLLDAPPRVLREARHEGVLVCVKLKEEGRKDGVDVGTPPEAGGRRDGPDLDRGPAG